MNYRSTGRVDTAKTRPNSARLAQSRLSRPCSSHSPPNNITSSSAPAGLKLELVASVRLNRYLDVGTAQLRVRVRHRGQGSLGRSVGSRPKADIIRNRIAGDLAIVEANVLSRVLEDSALDKDLRALTRVDAVGKDAVVVA